MRIYAIRDRMLDYFQVPFCAPDDNDVLAAMSQRMMAPITPGTYDAIQEAPHHFEVWKLGEVQKDGHIKSEIDFLADCSSLVRRGVRSGEGRIGDSEGSKSPESESRGQPRGNADHAATPDKANANAPQTASGAATPARRNAG